MKLQKREKKDQLTYMRGNEVGNEIKAKTPPNGAKDITCNLLHFSHQVNAVVHFREELEQEDK